MQRVAEGNLENALNTMADQAIAQEYDYAAYVQRVRHISPTMPLPSPSDYAPYVPLNALRKRSQNSCQLHMLITSLVLPEVNLLHPIKATEEGIQAGYGTVPITEYVARYDPEHLKGLALHSVLKLDSARFHCEPNQQRMTRIAAIYGYLEQQELLAFLFYNGELWQLGLSAARFEKGWQLTDLYAVLIGTDVSGGATLTDEAAVQALLDSGDYVLVYAAE